jgi:hypothetical protein
MDKPEENGSWASEHHWVVKSWLSLPSASSIATISWAISLALVVWATTLPSTEAEAKWGFWSAIWKAAWALLKATIKVIPRKIWLPRNPHSTFNRVFYSTQSAIDIYKLNNLTPESVQKLWEKLYKEFLEKAKKEGKIDTTSQLAVDSKAAMSAIVKELPQFPKYKDKLKYMNWEITVINDDTVVNAFCLPGGKMIVYSWLMKKLWLTMEEVAIVIWHEMWHALEDHALERMIRVYKDKLKTDMMSAATGRDLNSIRIFDLISTLSFSRENELEADTVWLILNYVAGFNIDAGVSLWEKFWTLKGSTSASIFSTHPWTGDRVENMKTLVGTIKADAKEIEDMMAQDKVKAKKWKK